MGAILVAIVVGAAGVIVLLVVFLVRLRRRRPLNVNELARRLDVPVAELQLLQPRYYVERIRKRSGGYRELQVPDKKTKWIQRRLMRRLFARLTVHEAVCGFQRGRSIVDNARPHTGQAVVIRIDVIDFFHSTQVERVRGYFRRIGWDEEAVELLVRLTTFEGGLPQGAPTSPRLSNLVNYWLDVQMNDMAQRRGGVYTRYADDITFSFPKDDGRLVRGTIQLAARILKSKGYRIHRRRKLHVRRRHQRQEVTGLVVNERVRLPRKTRRWLRAVKHRLESGHTATLTQQQLQGWLAFEQMVERS